LTAPSEGLPFLRRACAQVRMSQEVANFFVSEARRNLHKVHV
jgi:hypothetical protein